MDAVTTNARGRYHPRMPREFVSDAFIAHVESLLRDIPDGERQVVAIAGAEITPQGCNIELAEVVLHNEIWWSLAFEIVGINEDSRKALETISKQLFLKGDPPSFAASDSLSYPDWLIQFTR